MLLSGGTVILINSTFEFGIANGTGGGVAYLDEGSTLEITGILNR